MADRSARIVQLVISSIRSACLAAATRRELTASLAAPMASASARRILMAKNAPNARTTSTTIRSAKSATATPREWWRNSKVAARTLSSKETSASAKSASLVAFAIFARKDSGTWQPTTL